jgi:hypothetical protein
MSALYCVAVQLGVFRRLIRKAKGEYNFINADSGEAYAKALYAAAKREVEAWTKFEKECKTICGKGGDGVEFQLTEPESAAKEQLITGVLDSQLQKGQSIAALDTALGLRRYNQRQREQAAAAAAEAAAEEDTAEAKDAIAGSPADALSEQEGGVDGGSGLSDCGSESDDLEDGGGGGGDLGLADGESGPVARPPRKGRGAVSNADQALADAAAMTEALVTCHIDLHRGDWREWFYKDPALKETLAKAIRLFIPDPPTVVRSKRDRIGEHEMGEVVAAAKYFVHPEGTALIFCSWQQASKWASLLTKAGFAVDKNLFTVTYNPRCSVRRFYGTFTNNGKCNLLCHFAIPEPHQPFRSPCPSRNVCCHCTPRTRRR